MKRPKRQGCLQHRIVHGELVNQHRLVPGSGRNSEADIYHDTIRRPRPEPRGAFPQPEPDSRRHCENADAGIAE